MKTIETHAYILRGDEGGPIWWCEYSRTWTIYRIFATRFPSYRAAVLALAAGEMSSGRIVKVKAKQVAP